MVHNNLNKEWNLSILEICKDFQKSEEEKKKKASQQRTRIKCSHVCDQQDQTYQHCTRGKRLSVEHTTFRDETGRQDHVQSFSMYFLFELFLYFFPI